MFKLRRLTRVWVVVVLVVCAVFLAGANSRDAEASPLLATAPSLGTAGSFAVLGGSTVTNTGSTVVTGDLGVWPGLAITGFFSPGIVVPPGTIHAGDAVAHQAQNDVTAAYNTLASEGPCTDLSGQDLGSVPLATLQNGGVFCYSSSAQLTGGVTLNGNAASVWVFKIGSALTTASGSSVTVTGGASACNVFFQIGTSATLGTGTSFNGNILALASITLNTGANIGSGRALARNGAVTLDTNSINAGACSAGVAAGGVGVNKVFNPNSMIVGGVTTLTIALTNANGSAATITSFTDNLPSGLVVANPSNASTTCVGGTLVATAGSSTITLTGGTIPPAVAGVPGTCTIKVNVTAVAPGSYTNMLLACALQVTIPGASQCNTRPSSAVLSVNAASQPADVPEADTLLLFGGGIGGVATWLGWQWRKARSKGK